MFKQTLDTIKEEIYWINYELTRQSTTVEQEEKLRKRRHHLELIRELCCDYETEKYVTYLLTFESNQKDQINQKLMEILESANQKPD